MANSPLIVIGEVEKIENGQLRKRAGRSGFGEDEGESGRETPPTIATVRILRILKGRYPETRIRVGSGPVPTCGGDIHFGFEVGQRSIFLLPLDPQDGGVALHFGGSMLPLTETSLIEARIARAIAYRTAYLDNLQQEKPKVYAAALHLTKELRAESQRWPPCVYDEKTGDYRKEFKSGMTALKERLTPIDAETIIAAQAIDWLNDEPNIWWRHELWDHLVRELAEARGKETAAVQRAWVRKTLTDAGVEQGQIDSYWKYAKRDHDRAGMTFPIEPPFFCSSLHSARDGVLTTDFILRYYAYDRGGMLVAYAPEFNALVLGGLEMRRVKPLVASLYQSDGERLRWLGQQAINYVPGTECVDIVLDDLVQGGHDWAWRVLDHYKETAARLAALIDLGSKKYTIWGQQAMWRAFEKGECFEPICVEKALAALGRLEALEAKAVKERAENGKSAESRDEQIELANTLREYLAAAKTNREDTKPTVMSAADYGRWFKAHPAKKKAEDE